MLVGCRVLIPKPMQHAARYHLRGFNKTGMGWGAFCHRVGIQRSRLSPLGSKIGIGGVSRLRPSHTTVHTGPYTAIREVEHLTDGNKEGRPSDLKYAFENPVE